MVETWSECATDDTPYRNAKPPAASQQQQLHYSLTTEITEYTSNDTRHTPHDIRHTSQVTGNTPHVTRHTPFTSAYTRCYLRKNVR